MQDVFMAAFVDELEKIGGTGLARRLGRLNVEAPGKIWNATKTVANLPVRGAKAAGRQLGLGATSLKQQYKAFKAGGEQARLEGSKDPFGMGKQKPYPKFKLNT